MISHDNLGHSDLINDSSMNEGTFTTTAKTQIHALYKTMYGGGFKGSSVIGNTITLAEERYSLGQTVDNNTSIQDYNDNH